ncbi:protein phosphatase 1-binding protein bifocal isoform X2 [Musca autumnalis]
MSSGTSTSTTTNSGTQLNKREFSAERAETHQAHQQHSSQLQQQQQQCSINITGANNGSSNQSSSKCESERLVCAVNNSGSSSTVSSTTTTTTTVVKISQKLQENQFIKNEQQQVVNKTKIIKTIKPTAATTTTADLKSPTKTVSPITASSSSSLTSSFASSTNNSSSSNCAIKKKMVAMQEMKKSTQNSATHLHHSTCSSSGSSATSNGRSNRIGVGGGVHGVIGSQNSNDLDSNEDLSYGPGIVSKLRCRYLSLALRESMEQQRLNKDRLRRSTSLNNLLDDDRAEEEDDEEEDDDENIENIDVGGGQAVDQQQNTISSFTQKKSGILKNSYSPQEKRFTQGSNGVGVTFTETSAFSKRSRHLKRGNDSLKRARSVEALLSEKSPWQGQRMAASVTPTCVTIEDKIQNARERLHSGTDHMPPKRLTSIIDDTERPPPDLVKQTLKMFEANANRRPRNTNRSNSKGEVASKVETFKNIIKDQKPVVSYPKPLSPTKKLGGTPNLVKPTLKSSSELQQTPLGRKTMAAVNSLGGGSSDQKLNTLSEHTPDIIPRQKLHSEREQNNKEKYSMGINKEKFMNSLMESPLSANAVVDSPLKSSAKDRFLASMVDSPVTALSKELERMKLSDNTSNSPVTAGKGDNLKNDNLARGDGDGSEASGTVGAIDGISSGGGGDRGGADDKKVDDAFHNNDDGDDDNQYNKTSEQEKEEAEVNTNEFSSSLKSENDKIKQQQINNETPQSNSNNVSASTAAAPIGPSQATIEATVKKAHSAHSSSDLSDGEDDDEYGIPTTKRITRAALDNIAKAGTTQQFKFSSNTSSSQQSSSSSTTTTSVAGKQIGVIRPLQNTTATSNSSSTSTSSTTANNTNMDALKHSLLTSREIEKNRINDLKKSSSTSSASSTAASSSSSTLLPSSASLDNVIKSSSNNSGTTATGGLSEVDTVISATNSPLWAMRKRRQNPPPPPAEQTSMVFNFSNRKAVPDYIENDGVIFRRKRELPKPNESGFVLLGDLSVETSTDLDYDDFSMCPPSPCDVEFVNANIVIDGKSSIRQKSKDATFRVQFNDTLTSTFEYPSEASLIVDDSFSSMSGETELKQAFQNLVLENSSIPLHHVADEIIELPTTNESTNSPANTTATKNILGNLPLGSAPLGFYTPMKAPIDRLFQLGVTRAPSLECTTNGDGGVGDGGLLNGKTSSDNIDGEQEPESLQYIKPADDDLNIAYSESTQKTDLLY